MLDEREREITLRFLKSEGKKNSLILNKYAGIGRVLHMSFLEDTKEDSYDHDNPTGFRTGQCIDVQVTEGIVYSGKVFHKGDIVKRICSYGGDVGVAGKPEVGDMVGFFFGHYAQVWEKIDTSSM